MIYWSPESLKPFRIWAPVVFTLAENTAWSISLGFDRYLPGNFSITVRIIILLLELVSLSSFCRNSLDGFALAFFHLALFPYISLCSSSLPAPVWSRLWILQHCSPFWFLTAGQSGWEVVLWKAPGQWPPVKRPSLLLPRRCGEGTVMLNRALLLGRNFWCLSMFR